MWDWRAWRPHPPNKGDDLVMDDEMIRLGKIGIGMVRKEMKKIEDKMMEVRGWA